MANKKFFIVTHNNWLDSTKATLFQVEERIYRSMDNMTSSIRHKRQDNGECSCTSKDDWACDTDCWNCSFHRHNPNQVSFDDPVENPFGDSDDLTFADVIGDSSPSPEDIAIGMVMMEELCQEMAEIHPEGPEIYTHLDEGYSERETAEIIGPSRSTVKRHWADIKEQLPESMYEWLEDWLD